MQYDVHFGNRGHLFVSTLFMDILCQLDSAVLLRLRVEIKNNMTSKVETFVCPNSWFSNLQLKYLVTAANVKT